MQNGEGNVQTIEVRYRDGSYEVWTWRETPDGGFTVFTGGTVEVTEGETPEEAIRNAVTRRAQAVIDDPSVDMVLKNPDGDTVARLKTDGPIMVSGTSTTITCPGKGEVRMKDREGNALMLSLWSRLAGGSLLPGELAAAAKNASEDILWCRA